MDIPGPSNAGTYAQWAHVVECPICYNIYDKPMQMGCGHTLCSTCIGRLVDQVKTNMGADEDGPQQIQQQPHPQHHQHPQQQPQGRRPQINIDDQGAVIIGLGGFNDRFDENQFIDIPRMDPRDQGFIRGMIALPIDRRVDNRAPTEIKCPECRKPTIVPVDGLPVNYRVQEIVQKVMPLFKDRHLIKHCNQCEEILAQGVYFDCNQCNEKSHKICPTCAIRFHNGHDLVEKKALTSKDVRSMKEQIDMAARDAYQVIEDIKPRLQIVGGVTETRIVENLMSFVKIFEHMVNTFDGKIEETSTVEQLMEEVKKAEKISQTFEQARDTVNVMLATIDGAYTTFWDPFEKVKAEMQYKMGNSTTPAGSPEGAEQAAENNQQEDAAPAANAQPNAQIVIRAPRGNAQAHQAAVHFAHVARQRNRRQQAPAPQPPLPPGIQPQIRGQLQVWGVGHGPLPPRPPQPQQQQQMQRQHVNPIVLHQQFLEQFQRQNIQLGPNQLQQIQNAFVPLPPQMPQGPYYGGPPPQQHQQPPQHPQQPQQPQQQLPVQQMQRRNDPREMGPPAQQQPQRRHAIYPAHPMMQQQPPQQFHQVMQPNQQMMNQQQQHQQHQQQQQQQLQQQQQQMQRMNQLHQQHQLFHQQQQQQQQLQRNQELQQLQQMQQHQQHHVQQHQVQEHHQHHQPQQHNQVQAVPVHQQIMQNQQQHQVQGQVQQPQQVVNDEEIADNEDENEWEEDDHDQNREVFPFNNNEIAGEEVVEPLEPVQENERVVRFVAAQDVQMYVADENAMHFQEAQEQIQQHMADLQVEPIEEQNLQQRVDIVENEQNAQLGNQDAPEIVVVDQNQFQDLAVDPQFAQFQELRQDVNAIVNFQNQEPAEEAILPIAQVIDEDVDVENIEERQEENFVDESEESNQPPTIPRRERLEIAPEVADLRRRSSRNTRGARNNGTSDEPTTSTSSETRTPSPGGPKRRRLDKKVKKEEPEPIEIDEAPENTLRAPKRRAATSSSSHTSSSSLSSAPTTRSQTRS